MTKEQARLLRFAIRFPGWHTYHRTDRRAVRALRALSSHGLIELAEYTRPAWPMFRLLLATEVTA